MKNIVNVGIIGCGNISRYHIAAVNGLETTRLAAVSDNFAPNLEKVGKEQRVDVYPDYREMLRRDDIDAVAVLTASGTHAQIGMDCANAGKHVIVEKPVDVTLEHAQALIDCCKKNGVKLSCIFQHRFDRAVAAMKKAVEDGTLGRINCCCCQTRWYRDQHYYDCVDWRGTWKLDGGGALMNQSVHYIDLMQYMMGPVDEVFGYTATLAHERMETEDVGTAVVKFRSGALGMIEGTTSAYPGFATRLDLLGADGSVILENDVIKSWDTKSGSEFPEELKAKGPQPHTLQWADIADAILYGREPAVTGEEAVKALKIILAVYESRRTGRPVKIE